LSDWGARPSVAAPVFHLLWRMFLGEVIAHYLILIIFFKIWARCLSVLDLQAVVHVPCVLGSCLPTGNLSLPNILNQIVANAIVRMLARSKSRMLGRKPCNEYHLYKKDLLEVIGFIFIHIGIGVSFQRSLPFYYRNDSSSHLCGKSYAFWVLSLYQLRAMTKSYFSVRWQIHTHHLKNLAKFPSSQIFVKLAELLFMLRLLLGFNLPRHEFLQYPS